MDGVPTLEEFLDGAPSAPPQPRARRRGGALGRGGGHARRPELHLGATAGQGSCCLPAGGRT
ncbi:hypothetical protein QJS66_11965 [Kocuria rhizophila]|nr:hypothetical protein QJS66_11965 [Kocuria rhizophila]